MNKELKKIMEEYEAEKLIHKGKWFEFEVYMPYFGKNYPSIGMPIVFLEKDGKVRVATEKEYKDILSKEK